MKENTTLRIDCNLKFKAKKLRINLSNTLENSLRAMICRKEAKDIDIAALTSERDKIHKEIEARAIRIEEINRLLLEDELVEEEKDKKKRSDIEKIHDSLTASDMLNEIASQ